jgi:HlyD family secretion protein
MKKLIKSKLFLIALGVIILFTAGYWYYSSSSSNAETQYRFTNIEKGNIESIVTSTGTLNPVTTVQVGAQVSGIITQINVDFNSQVKKGELIALIDTTILVANVKNAQSTLAKARAQLEYSNNDFSRMKALFDKNLAAQSDYDLSKENYELAKAGVASAELELQNAKSNLGYAYIKAPIDGTVIARNVDPGQTVASSFSAPTLFLIGKDLSKMQILANVDESDIGQIKVGQNARFTVQAYPYKKFEGVVYQIRLSPATVSNVVDYTVVVNVDNKDGLLLPGMTATIDFLIQSADSVYKVSNSALRFKPTQTMIDQIKQKFQEMSKNLPDSLKNKFSMRMGQGNRKGGFGSGSYGSNGQQSGPPTSGTLWYLDDQGKLNIMRVRLGITDGQSTEIISDKIKPGMQVINGILVSGESASTNSSPFQQNNNQSPQMRRGF